MALDPAANQTLVMTPRLQFADENLVANQLRRERSSGGFVDTKAPGPGVESTPIARNDFATSNVSNDLRLAKNKSLQSPAEPSNFNNQLTGPKANKMASDNSDNGPRANNLRQAKRNALNRPDQPGLKMPLSAQGAKDMMNAGISALTSKALQYSWENIIDSYGLTLLYINFHVLMRFAAGPEKFCKLGHEWAPGGGAGKELGAASQATQSVSKSGKAVSSGVSSSEGGSFFGIPYSAIGGPEAGLLGLVDAIIFVSILQYVIPIFLVIAIMANPKLLWNNFGMLFTGIKAILGL